MRKEQVGELYLYQTYGFGELSEDVSVYATSNVNGQWISFNDVCTSLGISKDVKKKIFKKLDDFDKTRIVVNRPDKYGCNHEQEELFIRDYVVFEIIRDNKFNKSCAEEVLYDIIIDLGKDKHDAGIGDHELNYHDKVMLTALKTEVEINSINTECIFESLNNRYEAHKERNSNLIGFNNFEKDENGKYIKRTFNNSNLTQAYNEFVELGNMLEDVNTAIQDYLNHLDCGNNYDPDLDKLHSKAINKRQGVDYTWLQDDLDDMMSYDENLDDAWLDKVNSPDYEPPVRRYVYKSNKDC